MTEPIKLTNPLKNISKVLYDIDLPKSDIIRIYLKGTTALGIDLNEHASKNIDDLAKKLTYNGYSNIHVFPIFESKYHPDLHKLLYNLHESVIDAEKKSLNPAIWEHDNTLKPSIKTIIITAVNEITQTFAKVNNNQLTIKNIYLTGSNLGYYYNTYTDLDIHFTVDEYTDEIQTLMAEFIDEHFKDTISIQNSVLEFYLMTPEQEAKENIGGIYDVQADKWLIEPEKISLSDEDYNACSTIAMHYARTFDMIIGELKRDLIEYRLQDDLEDDLDVENERPEIIRHLKWNEIKANTDALVLAFDGIKQMRKDSFTDEFKQSDITVTNIQSSLDRSYTTNNVVFKILDRYGYIPLAKKFKYGVHKEMRQDEQLDKNRDVYIDKMSNILNLIIDEVK